MELNINSPQYYKDIYGVDNDIYKLCQELYLYFKEKKYSDIIDIIGIIPIIAPQELINQGKYKEKKYCSLSYGFAEVNLFLDYQTFVNANIEKKKALIVKNVIDSVKSIKTRGKIDFVAFKKDMSIFCKKNNVDMSQIDDSIDSL